MHMPLLAIAAYTAVICNGVTARPWPIGIDPSSTRSSSTAAADQAGGLALHALTGCLPEPEQPSGTCTDCAALSLLGDGDRADVRRVREDARERDLRARRERVVSR